MSGPMPDLESILERHRRFWARAAVDRPLLARLPTREWRPRPYSLTGGREAIDPTEIQAADIDLERFVGTSAEQTGDFIGHVGPAYPEAWMGALIGCPIYASAYGCVAKSTGIDLATAAEEFSVEQAFNSDWALLMDRVLQRAGEIAGDTLPVRQLHHRGVVDMLAAFLGEEALCRAVYDAPDDVRALAGKFAQLNVRAARRGLERRRPWHGGYASVWSLFAPGPHFDYQMDASSLFSPKVYGELFLKHDRAVVKEFEYSLMHLHGCGLHQLDNVLALDELSAVQINLDRETGACDKQLILSCCRRVQEAGKSLLIVGDLTDDELDELVASLDPRGLAIFSYSLS